MEAFGKDMIDRNSPVHRDGCSTPQWLFHVLDEQVRALTGEGFVLDAAAGEWNAKCPLFFDEGTDALRQDWSRFSPIFCNPPFRSELISQFATKALDAAARGSTVVLLLPYWQRYAWFQELKRRGRMQDIITPVTFEWLDGRKFIFNKDRRTLVVATLGPGITPGTNGEPITKPQAWRSSTRDAFQPQVPTGLRRPSAELPVLMATGLHPNRWITMKMRCANCGKADSLQVVVRVWADLIHAEEGLETEIHDPDHEWDEESAVRCRECGHTAPAKQFMVEDGQA
jgi:phage N-6-adenine-methyltransferase